MQINKFILCFTVLLYLIPLFPSTTLAQILNEDQIGKSNFPIGFLFGTATSSYQVEGAYNESGKGLSNWDVFSHIQGSIKNGENGDIADDHYHRFLEDIELMHAMGVNAYRFSISWSRILPRGRFGNVNPSGIMFYNKVIDNLLLRGMEPFVTIHHHDLPQVLEDKYGGWLSPEIQVDFVHFAEICFRSFGDRVKLWTTINEPNLVCEMAYRRGIFPPARCSAPFGNCSTGNSDVEPLVVMHNMLLAHAKTVKLYRKLYQPKQGGSIGIIASAQMYEPINGNELNRLAAERALVFNVAWTLDPLVFGDYPSEMRRYQGNQLPEFTAEEKSYVQGSIDFIGLNHYTTLYAMDCTHSTCTLGGNDPIRGLFYTTGERDGVPIGERTSMPTFFIVPRGMENIVNYVKNRYNNMPMYVTENGYAPVKQQNEQEQELLHDVKRIDFHKAYLTALVRAIRNGANVKGYFIWSLIDNFEWADGYSNRFGLVYVDRQTLQRTPKASAKWYSDFLSNGVEMTDKISYASKNLMISK